MGYPQPYPPVPRIPRQVQRRPASLRMTIAAGFNCCDGVVLTTDTLYSGTNQHHYGPKMWILQDQDPLVVFAAAGLVGAIERAKNEIQARLRPGLSLLETLDQIDRQLERIHRKFPPSGNSWMSVQALVAIRIDDSVTLHQTEGTATALSPVTLPWVCLGQEALGGYFAKFLFNEGMSIEWASIVAAHLVSNCKQYADGLCGGDTHIGQVPKRGEPRLITHQADVYMLEQHLKDLERAYRAVLPIGSPGESESPEALKARARAIVAAIGEVEMASFDERGEPIGDLRSPQDSKRGRTGRPPSQG